MGMREKLIEILSVPIYPHELVDPIEAVADYLIDNGVTIPVRCKDCKHYDKDALWCDINSPQLSESHMNWYEDDYCSAGERRTDG